MIEFSCNCGQRFKSDAAKVGQEFRCTRCGTTLTVPDEPVAVPIPDEAPPRVIVAQAPVNKSTGSPLVGALVGAALIASFGMCCLVPFVSKSERDNRPIQHFDLQPASREDLDLLNDNMDRSSRCRLTPERTWSLPGEGGRFVAGALNGPAVEDVVAIWWIGDRPGAIVIPGNTDARTFNEWGSAIPLHRIDGIIDTELASEIVRDVESRLKVN